MTGLRRGGVARRRDRMSLLALAVVVLVMVGWARTLSDDVGTPLVWLRPAPGLVILAIGVFLVLRTEARTLGWLLALQILFALHFLGSLEHAASGATWAGVLEGLGFNALTALSAAVILYPTGRPASRVLGFLVGLAVVLDLVASVHWTGVNLSWWAPLADPEELAVGLSALPLMLSFVEQARIYRRRPTVEQKQVKWYVLGLLTVPGYLVPGLLGWSDGAFAVVDAVLSMVFPVAILLGITRYRLYEIDRLVSRTVAYALVIGLLAGIFVGGVAALTSLLPAQGRLAVAVTTMAVVALFDPVRRRVTEAVDRRFDRTRYGARQVVEQFGRSIADVADQGEVRAHLSRVLGTTLAPATVAVWEPGRDVVVSDGR